MSVPLSLRAILGTEWNKFQSAFIYEPLARMAANGEISPEILRKINRYLEAYGKEALPFYSESIEAASKHNVRGGWLAHATIPVVREKLELHNFIKCFADDKSYRQAVANQQTVARAAQGTPLEATLREPVYTNASQRIIVTPFINGTPLDKSVPTLEPEAKVRKLQEIVDFYFTWKETLKPVTAPKLGDPLNALEIVLEKPKPAFLDAMKPICETLTQGKPSLIHGDLYLCNIIDSAGKYHFIDWESLAIGYEEIDFGKLFSKAQLTENQWNTLIDYTATKQASSGKKEEFVKRHWLNRIRQETFTIGRYLKRAKEHPSLQTMAHVAYATTLRTIERAIQLGFVEPALIDAFTTYFETERGLPRLSPKEYESLKATHDPNLKASFENVANPPSLEDLAELAPAIDVDKELKRLRKNLYAWPWRKIGNIAAAASILAAVMIGTGKGIQKHYDLVAKQEKARIESDQEYEDRSYHSSFRENFRKAIEVINRQHRYKFPSMAKAKDSSAYASEPTDVLPFSDPFVRETADKFGIELPLIARIFEVNRVYALTNSERDNPQFDGVNYFELQGGYYGRFGREVSVDPKKNLQDGLELLADFRNQFRASYKIKTPDLTPVLKHLRFVYGFLDESSFKKRLDSNDPRIYTDTVLDALALQDTMLAFYMRHEDQNGGKDNKRMARRLGYSVIRGLEGSETGLDIQWDWSIPKEFDFTASSELTRGKIAALPYDQLKQVRDVREKEAHRWDHLRKN